MYFLLFIIGFEINLSDLKKKSHFILKATLFIILFEAFFGTLLVRLLFGCDFFVSFLVALSFATVGEGILIPILDEFHMINTNLGQAIIGIGVFDDLFEILALLLTSLVIGSGLHPHLNLGIIFASLFLLFLLTIGFTKLKKEGKKFYSIPIETLFLLSIFIFFLFLGVGFYADSLPLASLLAGVSIRTFIPHKRLELIESEIKTMAYGFFAPIFFAWVGLSMDIKYLMASPLLVLLLVVVSMGAKLLGTYIVGRSQMNFRRLTVLGIGLSVRLSTSIVIIKLLFDQGIISQGLYSVVVASTIIFTLSIPVIFSYLLVRWNIAKSFITKASN